MVGCLGGNFADSHHFISGNADGILKSVDVPLLEEGDVKADVRWVEVAVLDYFVEEAGEVFDVVHSAVGLFFLARKGAESQSLVGNATPPEEGNACDEILFEQSWNYLSFVLL